MKFRLGATCALFAIGLAGSAFADGPVTATLANSQAPAKFIAAHTMWSCDGSICTAAQAPDDAAGLDGCEDLAKKVGAITAFGGRRALSDKSLAKCNTVAKAPATIGTASR